MSVIKANKKLKKLIKLIKSLSEDDFKIRLSKVSKSIGEQGKCGFSFEVEIEHPPIPVSEAKYNSTRRKIIAELVDYNDFDRSTFLKPDKSIKVQDWLGFDEIFASLECTFNSDVMYTDEIKTFEDLINVLARWV